jgi:peptide/nickel transport system permease protein
MGIETSTSPPSAALQVEPLAGPAMLERPGGTGGPARTGGIKVFILRRILQGLLVLVLVSIVVFAATQALPGDPARAILGRGATPASLAALREQLHLNQPKVVQYLTWATGLLHGDAGRSFAAQEPVSTYLSDRIVNTGFLLLISGLISIPLSILIGAYAALWRDRPFDVITSLATLVFAALPEFVVGVALVLLFATTVFHFLPAITLIPPGGRPWDQPIALILPTLTLVLAVTPYVVRIMRASMVEVLESDYVEMARLKGLPERIVLRRHALPNALGPTFQVIAINLAYLAGGVIVVEYIFNYAGIGGALRDAVSNRDLPVVQAIAMIIAGLYVFLNLMADIATILVTPRLRTRL